MWVDDIAALLARYPASARPTTRPEALGNAGGFSGARLWRYESGRGPLVLRGWPVPGMDRERLIRIHRWLAGAAHLGFIPVPLMDLGGRTVQEWAGRLWDLSPWMPGAADLRRPPPGVVLRAGFAGLAAFHQSVSHQHVVGTSPGLARRIAEIGMLQAGGFDALERAVGLAPEADPRREPARRWLAAARGPSGRIREELDRVAGLSLPLQPCLRDIRPDHLLFSGERLTGLIDFGALDIETVAADLARLLNDWVGPDRPARTEALDAYEAVRPLSDQETRLIGSFERSAALLSGAQWVRWHFLEGRVFDDPEAVRLGLERANERIRALAAGWDQTDGLTRPGTGIVMEGG